MVVLCGLCLARFELDDADFVGKRERWQWCIVLFAYRFCIGVGIGMLSFVILFLCFCVHC